MTQGFFFLYYLCRFILPLSINECLFLPYIERRKYFWIIFPICFALFILATFLITYFNIDIILGGWFRFNFLMIFILSLIPFLVSTKVGLKQMFFFAMASYAMQNLADKSTAFLIVGINVSLYGYDSLLIFLFGNLFFSILFYLIFVLRTENHSLDAMNNKYIYTLMGITILIVYVLSMYAPVVESFDRTFITISIYSITSCLLLLITQFNLFNFGFLEYEKKTLVNLLDKENEYYKQVKANIDSINIKTHDLRHQIRDLRQVVTEENEVRALDDLEKEVQIYDNSIKTGNPTLDILIQDKKFYCHKHDIVFSSLIDGEALKFMDQMDIYSLFGNLLDNAIQAVLKLPKDRRVAQLNVKTKQGFVIIQTINAHDGKVKFLNDMPITTKDNSLHGFGSKSIVYIAKKYNGKVTFKSKDDGSFEVNVFLPVK